ncbi:MAG: DUF2971 domain-containing protein [Ferrovibrio sp.]|uniref:DUF2971 domain-containing protein n=1 Tax=Ferrovibrio sp. TaxID=1917215 RepID=UPI00391B7BEB
MSEGDSYPAAPEPIKVPVAQKHPELHHYTRWDGLEGIWKSQQLWAVRYDALNDPTEFRHVRGPLVEAIIPFAKNYIRRKRLGLQRLNRAIIEGGGIDIVAAQEVRSYIDAIYEATEKARTGDNFIVPHITSFCTHSGDHDYERFNGLLSQWRGYGGEESFAVVFDTARLEAMLKEEHARFEYIGAVLTEAIYADDEFNMETAFPRLTQGVGENWRSVIQNDQHNVGQHLEDLLDAAIRIKHRAFHEEREVRIVVFPVDPGYASSPYGREIKKPVKPPETFRKPHVSLFGPDLGPLPITRIIVGPSRDQDAVIEKVRKLVDDRVLVSPSSTPFRP